MRGKTVLRGAAALCLLSGVLFTGTASADDGSEAGDFSEVTAATVAAAGVSSRAATIGGYPVWAHFTNPRAGRDWTINTELVRLIDNVPAGSMIRGTIHSLTIARVPDALRRAQARDVDVAVVVDKKNQDLDNAGVDSVKLLAKEKFCTGTGAGRACISTSATGDMHTKMFTFGATTDPNGTDRTDVSWFGSANETHGSGTEAFNNTVTVYGDKALYNGLIANFMDMWAMRHYPDNDYYDSASGRGYYMAGAADAYASPEQAGESDTIVTRLNDNTPDANCRMRIGMARITTGRTALLNLVTKWRAAGCHVWMAVGTNLDTGGIYMPKSIYDTLLGAGVKIRHMDKVHDKTFLVYAKNGAGYQYRVYTGSQNWTGDALIANDELFVKMAPETGATHPLYDAYYTHFNDAYNHGVTCTTSNYPCN